MPLFKHGVPWVFASHWSKSDLWTLDEFDRTQTYSERLQRNWDYEVDRWRRSQPDISTPEGTRVRRTLYEPSLTKALIKTVWAAFIQTAGLRIIGDVAVFISPQVMRLCDSPMRRSDPAPVGEIVNLMAVDAQRFAELIHRVQILWSAPFQISLALYFLWQALGPSALAGLGVMILLIPITPVTIRYLRRLQVANMKKG
ncbi:putative Multidrug resistance-associated protein 1 [Hypsibius exemplaris]|uniref:Multidrug resistance-associated protein 1 n=1 Tax=Hypsibius exemplaris TaxID=2072580 RepID=A0A9X6NG30_HYPEX|nr:putative Multidrug resistance-associated protein 1 [Hypsibius exemplaris]